MRYEYQSKFPDVAHKIPMEAVKTNVFGTENVLEEAVDLVLFAFEHGQNGDVFVQKAPACTIQTQVEAVCELFGGDKNKIKVIGVLLISLYRYQVYHCNRYHASAAIGTVRIAANGTMIIGSA